MREREMTMNARKNKSLVAFFSREGANFVNGKIVRLDVGNTRAAAEIIAGVIPCDSFRIQPVNAYPEDYPQAAKAAQDELRAGARPEISGRVTNMPIYGVILLGYPNWWGTMPMPVYTFLEQYDFSSKTILPFCTHEGSGMSRSIQEIKKLCPGADVRDGLAIQGGSVSRARPDIEKWLRANALL
jgi:flavodoxin